MMRFYNKANKDLSSYWGMNKEWIRENVIVNESLMISLSTHLIWGLYSDELLENNQTGKCYIHEL